MQEIEWDWSPFLGGFILCTYCTKNYFCCNELFVSIILLILVLSS
jgi:hypothetical protein